MLKSLIALCAVVLTLAACAPVVMGEGPAVVPPRLMADGGDDAQAFTTRDGLKLGVSSWQAAHPRALVVAFHGMNDYARFVRGPAAYWRTKGISTYAIDQRGFGRSPQTGFWAGDDAMIDDFRDFTAAVAARHPGVPLYLLGESMGGAVVLSGLGRPNAPTPAGVILIAPAVWGWSSMNVFYKTALWIASHTLPGSRLTGGGLKIMPSDNIEALRDLGRDPLVIKPTRTDAVYGLVGLMDDGLKSAARVKAPVLLLYGQNDQIVPRGPIQKLAAALDPAPRIGLYPNGYHLLMRDLGRQQVWNDVLAFIDGSSGPLPSGYEFKRDDLVAGKMWSVPRTASKTELATHTP